MTERQTVRRSQIIRQRLHRQGLVAPLNAANEGAYRRLFRRLQPVAPVHRSRPGNPPRLVHRTRFDDAELTARWRRRQVLIKGRFCGGRVGYVLAEDLEPYAVALQKPLTRVKPIHRDILHVIRRSSGITKTQLKDELPYAGGRVTTSLNRLQEAFLVYERQIDTDWDAGWLDFAAWRPAARNSGRPSLILRPRSQGSGSRYAWVGSIFSNLRVPVTCPYRRHISLRHAANAGPGFTLPLYA